MPERTYIARDIEILRGIEWSEEFVLSDAAGDPVDLTNHTLVGIIKTTDALDGTTLTTFTTTIVAEDAVNGLFRLTLSEAQTAALTAAKLAGYWFVYYYGASTANLKMPIYTGKVKVH